MITSSRCLLRQVGSLRLKCSPFYGVSSSPCIACRLLMLMRISLVAETVSSL